MFSRKLLAPCGLYCGICPVYTASREEDPRSRRRLAECLGCAPEDLACDGCLSDNPSPMCRNCRLRDCAVSRGLSGCHLCPDFPCSIINEQPLLVARTVVVKALNEWRELGDEAWAMKWTREEAIRCLCPYCGYALLRGARHCWCCNKPQPD